MAIQLALGCASGVHRKCCQDNTDPSTCSHCKNATAFVIGGSAPSTGPGACGSEAIDGTYAIPSTFNSTCAYSPKIYTSTCSSPSRTESIDVTLRAYGYGLVVIPTSFPSSSGPVSVPYPYTSGMRVVLSILYAISTNVQETYYYLADFSACPSGLKTLSFVSRNAFDLTSGSLIINSSAPSTIQLVFP